MEARPADERAEAAARHIPKRARRDKNTEAVFDEKARRDFLTGFHKRKKQRRKAAEHQLVQKARQSRVEARKQRREELKKLIAPCDEDEEEEGDDDGGGAGAVPTSAVTYPGVTVTIAPLDAAADEAPRRERKGAARTSQKKR